MAAPKRTSRQRPRPGGWDAALAAAVTLPVAALTVLAALRLPAQSPGRTVLDWALILTVCGALLLLRRHPTAVCAYALVAAGVYYVLSPVDGPLMVAVMVSLYGVAAAGKLVTAAALSALTVIGAGLGTLAGNDEMNGIALTMMAGWVVAMVALGTVRHSRQEMLRAADQRAAEQALRRATEERLRIARELHDVIGHNISLISVQASTALHRIDRDPGQAESALGVIKDASRETLRELRSTLGVLRQVDEDAPTRPPGGLARLDELVRYAELAGLETTVRIEGEPRPLTADLDLAAYRILQESITNVTRHAAARSLSVRIDYGATGIGLEVEDDGRGTAVTAGNGVTGMRERARALGGELTAGPRDGGGFRVRARLPYGDGAG